MDEGRLRGWMSAIMIGDTGTGKTTICQNIFEFARVGDRVSGMTSSRTGITYGIEHDSRKGWRIKAGALLKMSRQALIVDEAQDVDQAEIKTMAEGIETGITKIDRIQARIFESQTRCVFSCNPRHPRVPSEQLTLGDYDHGALALDGLFPSMLIRRVDFCLFASQDDIAEKEEIFKPPADVGPQQVTADDLRNLIFYAWNLEPEQIVISPQVSQEIRESSLELSRKYGCGKPPVVYPEDFRKTFARLCVAFAVLDLSCSEDFTQVIVRPGHVHLVYDFIDRIYEAENCRLHKVAEEYRRQHGLADEDEIKAMLETLVEHREGGQADRQVFILGQLMNGEWFKQTEIAQALDLKNRRTIIRDMKIFNDFGLVAVSHKLGCRKSPKLTRLLVRLEKKDPEFYQRLKQVVAKIEKAYEG